MQQWLYCYFLTSRAFRMSANSPQTGRGGPLLPLLLLTPVSCPLWHHKVLRVGLRPLGVHLTIWKAKKIIKSKAKKNQVWFICWFIFDKEAVNRGLNMMFFQKSIEQMWRPLFWKGAPLNTWMEFWPQRPKLWAYLPCCDDTRMETHNRSSSSVYF